MTVISHGMRNQGDKQITMTATCAKGVKYTSITGLKLKRESGRVRIDDGQTVDMDDRWVLRDANSRYMDHDGFIHDLAERHNLKLIG